MTQRIPGDGEDKARTPEEIQTEIHRTRTAIQQDVKTIGEKFTAEQIKENAKGVISDAKQEGATMVRETKDAAVGSLRSARDNAMETVNETAHELSSRARHAGELAGEYARQAGDYARQAGGSTAAFVSANALPLSLIGLGVGWLVMSSRRPPMQTRYLDDGLGDFDEDYYGMEGEYEYETPRRGRAAQLAGSVRGRAESLAHSAQDRAEGLVHTAQDRANELAQAARERAGTLADGARGIAEAARGRVGEIAQRATSSVDAARTRITSTASHLGDQASELSHEARERLHRAQLRTRDFADENPLAMGAIAIAAGVGVGLLLPTTQPENRLMGEARDRLLGNARGILDEARDAAGAVGSKAREAAEEIRNAAGETRVSH